MRSQLLLLIAVMAISLNAHPFLRKLADTKDSCAKAGKDYEEIPAQCKAGDKIYNVTKEEECKSGTWEALDTPKCSVSAITEKKDCTGTPKYTAAVTGSAASCKKGNVEISRLATSRETCEVQLKWTAGSCSIPQIKKEEDCSGKPTFTQGTNSCKLGQKELKSIANSATTCVALHWVGGACSATEITEISECTGTPIFSEGETKSCKLGEKDLPSIATDSTTCVELHWVGGACSATEISEFSECTGTPSFVQGTNSCKKGDVDLPTLATSSATCEVDLNWTPAECTVEEITEETLCTGTPTFKDKVEASDAKCTLGKTEITDSDRLKDQTSCETPLVWLTGTCKDSTEVTVEDICKSNDPEFTAATGKCVDKASSNSNSFLSFKFALILVVYLLF